MQAAAAAEQTHLVTPQVQAALVEVVAEVIPIPLPERQGQQTLAAAAAGAGRLAARDLRAALADQAPSSFATPILTLTLRQRPARPRSPTLAATKFTPLLPVEASPSNGESDGAFC